MHAIIHLNSYRFSFPIKSLCIISYECNHRASPSPLPSRRLGAVCVCASTCAHRFYPERGTELCRGLNRHTVDLLLSAYNLSSLSIYPSNRKTNIVLVASKIAGCCFTIKGPMLKTIFRSLIFIPDCSGVAAHN